MRRYLSQMNTLLQELTGCRGTRYASSEIIYERPRVGTIWVAKSTNTARRFILKDVAPGLYYNFRDNIEPHLPSSGHVRIPVDRIPGRTLLVYDYLRQDLWRFAQEDVPQNKRKQVLRAALRGLANLHDRDIVHLDIKPHNIMIDYRGEPPSITLDRVQIIDLENAAYLPDSQVTRGMLAGNDNWRSPEAHFRSDLHKPTDIFSFAIVCIYVVMGRAVFVEDDDFRHHVLHGAEAGMIRLQRQVSYFGDESGYHGLMARLHGEDILRDLLRMLWEERTEDYIPYKHFSDWDEPMDDDFRDLILQMTSLDPARRISASECLSHPWFRETS